VLKGNKVFIYPNKVKSHVYMTNNMLCMNLGIVVTLDLCRFIS